eukprot:CAMPEP_0118943240 /NCGR_PEP_ID=MMETSP1169-20130426/37897_1 /TAXON_ID=36882 /ORGANISM="Pyramimonas obovata, Strain CCMP722" /LENGTH=266 /DNA_ID=CAMNT_0006888447 /DNA_START=381 /DNA_END=1181 /DNA_ORIENTATION=+
MRSSVTTAAVPSRLGQRLQMSRRRQGGRQVATHALVDDYDAVEVDQANSPERTWASSLNWTEIRPRFLVGTCPLNTADLDRLINDAGVTGFVCLQTDKEQKKRGIDYPELYNHAMERGIAWTRLAVEPDNEYHQSMMLPDATRLVQAHLSAGRKVYLFGNDCINRTILTTIAYLCYLEKVPMEEAIIEAGQLRPLARANTELWLEVHKESLTEEARGVIGMRDYRQVTYPWGRNGDMNLWFKEFMHLVVDHQTPRKTHQNRDWVDL